MLFDLRYSRMSEGKLWSEYLISLQSSQIHHVIAQLGHLGHQVYCFLLQRKPTHTCMTIGFESKLLHIFEFKYFTNI